MGTRLIVLGQLEVTDVEGGLALLDWLGGLMRSRKQLRRLTVPQTDTGGLVEHTKALERRALKELGKLPP
jgi:hypothetical protein